MHVGPALGKSPSWKVRNESVTQVPNRPRDKARPVDRHVLEDDKSSTVTMATPH